MRSLKRFVLILPLALLAVPALYGLAAWTLGSVTAPHREPQPDTPTLPVYLLSNGWHVWLALPLRPDGAETAPEADWSGWLPAGDFAGNVEALPYIAFGWGDRDFYLATRQLQDIRPGPAIGALLGRGPAAMHVMRLAAPDPAAPDVRRIDADPLQYHALVAYIRRGFATGPDGRPQPIAGAAYGPRDAFYEATGRYSPLRTCNEWIGAGLRAAALPAGLWTPLPFTLMR
ncbi:TIGR02117 family protein [Ferrovibrio sp.]|uniref:TIGR02117 family protein n=1 Tax=Ferrovibrio sp. TaxID=1917215 RepID=UPI00311D688C